METDSYLYRLSKWILVRPIERIKTLYNKSLSRVLQNGSEPFMLERGFRQDYSLSPNIFIICAEILTIIVRNNESIKGINTDGQECLISSPESYGTCTTL